MKPESSHQITWLVELRDQISAFLDRVRTGKAARREWNSLAGKLSEGARQARERGIPIDDIGGYR